jgi:hypothetical protein
MHALPNSLPTRISRVFTSTHGLQTLNYSHTAASYSALARLYKHSQKLQTLPIRASSHYLRINNFIFLAHSGHTMDPNDALPVPDTGSTNTLNVLALAAVEVQQ